VARAPHGRRRGRALLPAVRGRRVRGVGSPPSQSGARGLSTTTRADHTARSETDHRSAAFTTSVDRTARPQRENFRSH
jgi:hypothetical protein